LQPELKATVDAILNPNVVAVLMQELGYSEATTKTNFRIRDESHPSASISRTGYIKDFGGDFTGDIYSLVQRDLNLDFRGSLNWIATQLNLSTDDNDNHYQKLPTKYFEASQKKEEKPSYDYEWIKAQHQKNVTHEKLLNGVRELYPCYDGDVNSIRSFLGYSDFYNSLTIELDGIATAVRNANGQKWKSFGSKQYIKTKIKTDDEYIFLASGMAEIIALEEFGYSYILLQMDGVRLDEVEEPNKIVVVLQENDESSRKLTQRCIEHFDRVKVVDIAQCFKKNAPKNYDLRDFINDQNDFKISKIKLDAIVDFIKVEKKPAGDERIIKYEGKYIPKIGDIDSGVIVAVTGAGKTYSYEGQSGVLIIVPRTKQTDIGAGENEDFLMTKIYSEGAMITFDKFYGHYRQKRELYRAIESGHVKLVVDEAHILISKLSKMHKVIYEINEAIFMSGTLEKFFRSDLQRYRYIPKAKTKIYFCNGVLPKKNGSIVFAESAKGIIKNYNHCGFVSLEWHKEITNVNLNTTKEPLVVATSAIREGISIHNPNFKYCMVDMDKCKLWSNKDLIQAVHRVRGDDIYRVISKPPKEQESKIFELEWWTNFINKQTRTTMINAIMGEYYSNMIKLSHRTEDYNKANEYGIVCYLAHRTKNNYDPDLYEFIEYGEIEEGLELDLSLDDTEIDEESGKAMIETKDKVIWLVPLDKMKEFKKWLWAYNSGLVNRLMRIEEPKNLAYLYQNSRLGRTLRADYKHLGRGKYSISLFYNLVREIVQLEIYNKKGDKIHQNKNIKSLKDISILPIFACGIEGVELFEIGEFEDEK